MEDKSRTYTAFAGARQVATGDLTKVLTAVKKRADRGATDEPFLFEDATGKQVDFDLRGTLEKVLERVRPAPVGPGRPRLGVVSREVSLLPAQWDWLEAQPSGISATLRQLIEAARRKTPGAERARMARDAAYRFMTAMAGDRPGFEEALRALYAGEKSTFEHHLRRWPADVRRHAERLAAPSFE